jgi:hypothetical protein
MVCPCELNLLDDIQAFDDSAEYHVLVVEMGSCYCGYEELAAIGIRTAIL